MEGIALGVERRRDEQTTQAWMTANFAVAAYANKLKPLDRYLIQKPKRPAFNPDEALAAFQELAARGKASVRRVH